MTIAIVDDELETRQYMQGLVAPGRGVVSRRVRASGHCADGY